jgi:ABC-2 type transport system permease protein
MTLQFSDNARIFYALLCRDLKMLKRSLKDALIDCCVGVATRVVLIGYLFPLMGMSLTLLAPLYIGVVSVMLINVYFAFAMHILFDLRFNRIIEYHVTLPIGRLWLFAEYIINFALQAACICIPSLLLGLALLGSRLDTPQPDLLLGVPVILLVLLVFATFFLALSFLVSFDWFMLNSWPRLISPLLACSCTFFTWKQLAAFSTPLGYLFLANPLTYIAEGLRAAIIGGSDNLPIEVSVAMLCISLLIAGILLKIGIKRRLDPV